MCGSSKRAVRLVERQAADVVLVRTLFGIDAPATRRDGAIRSQRRPRGAHGLIIAATAPATGCMVVTTDQAGFDTCPGSRCASRREARSFANGSVIPDRGARAGAVTSATDASDSRALESATRTQHGACSTSGVPSRPRYPTWRVESAPGASRRCPLEDAWSLRPRHQVRAGSRAVLVGLAPRRALRPVPPRRQGLIRAASTASRPTVTPSWLVRSASHVSTPPGEVLAPEPRQPAPPQDSS